MRLTDRLIKLGPWQTREFKKLLPKSMQPLREVYIDLISPVENVAFYRKDGNVAYQIPVNKHDACDAILVEYGVYTKQELRHIKSLSVDVMYDKDSGWHIDDPYK